MQALMQSIYARFAAMPHTPLWASVQGRLYDTEAHEHPLRDGGGDFRPTSLDRHADIPPWEVGTRRHGCQHRPLVHGNP